MKLLTCFSLNLILLSLIIACKHDEFPVGSSSFEYSESDTTIIYVGRKAGDFLEAAKQVNWSGKRKLIARGNLNNRDLGAMKRFVSIAFRGEITEVDLREVNLLEGQIINRPFTDLQLLKRFVYPRKLKSTGDFALLGSNWLEEIIIPEEVETIGATTFEPVSRNWGIQGGYYPIHKPYMAKEMYQLPNMVKHIGMRAFSNYPYSEIDFPESVETMGESCFSYSQLKRFVFPPKVTIVPDYCFSYNKYLTEVVLHDNITHIGSYPFIPDVKSRYSLIKELHISDNVQSVGKGFLKGLRLTHFNWPKSLKHLGDNALEGSYFEDLSIPPQIISLGSLCFLEAECRILRLHKDIHVLGRGFINNTKKLEELHVAWQIPPADNKLFEDMLESIFSNDVIPGPDFKKVKLFVPLGTSNAYRQASGWKNFEQIIEK